ncbi:hypothetical protein FRC03_005898 [Tulasnella sp. 419]|nr:hypothetical protein FRC03_005898 [Tulasnella sp. 419]
MSRLDIQSVATVTIGIALAYGISKVAKSGRREPQLPPGPPTLPILGNLASVPLEHSYAKFTEWSRKYGSVYSLKFGSNTVIVISSLDAIHEIMEKNGASTGSRPEFAPILRFSGPGRYVLFKPYGNEVRKYRKVFAELMKPSTREHVNTILRAEMSQLLHETKQNPDQLFDHIKRYSASTMFSVIAGQRIPQVTSPLCKEFFETWDLINDMLAPGHTPPVEMFPILNYIPDRLARNWKSKCDIIKHRLDDFLGGLKKEADKRLAEKKPNGSFLETILQMRKEWGIDEEGIQALTGALLFGGAATPASAVQWVIFIAAAYPEFQRKVQQELDDVIGDTRAPTVDDLPHLPYLSKFIKEVFRFRPVNPLPTPHAATEDTIYQGNVIPKDSTIFVNHWAICHDPELFDDPETFNPDRFETSTFGMKSEVEKATDHDVLKRFDGLTFGYGRRRCPGELIAKDALGHVSASLLWAFEFSAPLDKEGKEIRLDPWDFECGLSNYLLPRKLTIKPRSDRHMQILKNDYSVSTSVFQPFELELAEEDRLWIRNVRETL